MKPLPSSVFALPNKDRVCILGWTGSGKTTLAKALLSSRRNVIVLDTKHSKAFDSLGYRVDEKTVYRVTTGRYVYKVEPDFLVDELRPERFFRWALAAGNRIIYIDELLHMTPVPGLKILATQGREANENGGGLVGLWVSSQRPSGVPLYTISEAQHFFIFHLRLKADRDRMEMVTGAAIPWDYLRKHKYSFVYASEDGTLYGPARLAIE